MLEKRYRGLLAGNWRYTEDLTNLPDLKTPLHDVSRLAAALTDRRLGIFSSADISTVLERASYEIDYALDPFFGNAGADEVLLFFYSGYGLSDDQGSLYLCGKNTRTDRKRSTTVAGDELTRIMNSSNASDVLVILDIRYDGNRTAAQFVRQLAGNGRGVLVNCQPAHHSSLDSEEFSKFTGTLLKGLYGAAVPAGGRSITFAELCRYVVDNSAGNTDLAYDLGAAGGVTLAQAIASEPETPGPTGGSGDVSATLFVSENLIEVNDLAHGEAVPIEKVYVTARSLAGYPAPWVPSTDAGWVGLGVYPDRLEITLDPPGQDSRANVQIRNQDTGAVRTVRIVVRVRSRDPGSQPVAARAAGPEDGDDASVSRREVTFADRQPLVDALLTLSGMNDNNLRSLYVNELEASLGRPLGIRRYADPRHDVWSMVSACLERPGALLLLADLLRALHGDSEPIREVRRLAESIESLPSRPVADRIDKSHRLQLADQYFILSHDSKGGTVVQPAVAGAGLAGAVIAEMLLSRRVSLDGDELHLAETSKFADPVYELTRQVMNRLESTTLLKVIGLLRKEVSLRVAHRLVDQEVVHREVEKKLFKTVVRYRATLGPHTQKTVDRVRKCVIAFERELDQETAFLTSLVGCTGIVGTLELELAKQQVDDRLGYIYRTFLSPDLRQIIKATDGAIGSIVYGPTNI